MPLMAGVSREDIVASLHRAVARRVSSMFKNAFSPPVVFTGGGAKNKGLRRALETELGVELLVPEEPRITGALGAALIGWEKLHG